MRKDPAHNDGLVSGCKQAISSHKSHTNILLEPNVKFPLIGRNEKKVVNWNLTRAYSTELVSQQKIGMPYKYNFKAVITEKHVFMYDIYIWSLVRTDKWKKFLDMYSYVVTLCFDHEGTSCIWEYILSPQW